MSYGHDLFGRAGRTVAARAKPQIRLTSLPRGFFATGTASLHLLKQASQ